MHIDVPLCRAIPGVAGPGAHLRPSRLDVIPHAVAPSLHEVTVQRLGPHTRHLALQVVGDRLGVALPVDKDDRVAQPGAARVAVALVLRGVKKG
jgi:hypothetical protein